MWKDEPLDSDNDPEEDVRKQNALEDDPNPERGAADWLMAIGPEDMSRDEVMEELEASGFDTLEEDFFPSNPSFPSDMPTWTDSDDFEEEITGASGLEAALLAENENLSNERPVEDQAIRELEAEGDEPED